MNVVNFKSTWWVGKQKIKINFGKFDYINKNN